MITQLIYRRNDIFDQCKTFFEKCMNNISMMTTNPLKVLISIAMIYGNPIFNQIPKIISDANEEVD